MIELQWEDVEYAMKAEGKGEEDEFGDVMSIFVCGTGAEVFVDATDPQGGNEKGR